MIAASTTRNNQHENIDNDVVLHPQGLRSTASVPNLLQGRPVSLQSQFINRLSSISERQKQNVSGGSCPASPTTSVNPITANIGSKNGNMVLQLVLPSSNHNQNSNHLDNNNYMTQTSIDEFLERSGNHQQRRKHSGSLTYSSLENSCYANQGFNNDFGNFVVDPPSPMSLQLSTPEQNNAADEEEEEKKRNFRRHLTNILSSMYAVFVVTLGLIVYISDVFLGNSPLAESFSLYLVIIALTFLIYLLIDIRIYMKKLQLHNDIMEKNTTDDIEMKESQNGDFQLNITLPEAVRVTKQLQHRYCYSKDRHSANFYLKIGAAGFCIGHLIHSGLLLGYQILFLTSDGDAFYECATVISLILDIIYPIYSFFLLYFIFKYSNLIINRHVAIVRFGLMHCISSSLCFWIWTILRETIEALSNHDYEHQQDDDINDKQISEVAFLSGTGPPVALPLNSYNKKGAQLLTAYLNSSVRQFVGLCNNDAGLNLIYRNYSPYLYPFSVEYSILVVGVLLVIWQSIGKCMAKEEMSQSRRHCDSREGNSDNLVGNVVIHADFHSANKGLFGGIVVMVVSVVSIILFFIAYSDERYDKGAIFINNITLILILVLMTVTGIFAYRQITKLDVNNDHVSWLDDLLLYICIPAFFINGILSLIPAVLSQRGLSITVVIIEVAQVLVQTPLIIDGLRRCSNKKELRRGKPGRELLTFLIVSNVAMWITQTFEIQSHGLQDNRYDFYGVELWTIIGHMCIPLMMFYRFHSSVCIADIWKHAYEPSTSLLNHQQ